MTNMNLLDEYESNFDISRLKEINPDDKHTVFGFIRSAQTLLHTKHGNDNPFYTIPELVSFICLAFYCCAEYFCTINSGAKYFDNQRRIAHIPDNNKNVTCYGVIDIPSTDGRIHIWTLKINHIGSHKQRWGVCIGIDDAERLGVDSAFCYQRTNNYAYYGQGQYLCSDKHRGHTDGYDTDDIIGMRLNLYDKTLSYSKNDGKMKQLFEDVTVRKDLKYCLAIHLRFSHADVSLINYTSYKP